MILIVIWEMSIINHNRTFVQQENQKYFIHSRSDKAFKDTVVNWIESNKRSPLKLRLQLL